MVNSYSKFKFSGQIEMNYYIRLSEGATSPPFPNFKCIDEHTPALLVQLAVLRSIKVPDMAVASNALLPV